MKTSFATRQPLVWAALTGALALLPPALAFAQEPAKPAAATASASGTSASVVTEAKRREINQAAKRLTSETFVEVLRRAEAGDVEAQVLASIALKDGEVVPKDMDRAMYWARAAAEKSHPMAQNILGNLYRGGLGMPEDALKAVEWYSKAAAQGYAQGQSNLGAAYFDGFGGPANPVEAVRLFRLAAEQDNLDGQFGLGLAYTHGRGVEKDLREGVVWYGKAAEGGEPRGTAQSRCRLSQRSGRCQRQDGSCKVV